MANKNIRRRSASQKPRRKALVIGINYDTKGSDDTSGYSALHGPRSDAISFANLLINKYNYKREDVVIMLDGQGPELSHLAPTRRNMLREINNLVRGARRGDRFVFLYSGHSDQIPCLEHSEEDDLDEVILPMDHEGLEKKEKLIVDNDLRRLLVDPLPAGAHLTAIFDSCHSGTLLDLDHYACNNVYHPWISKGFRRVKTMWRNNVRQNATLHQQSLSATSTKLHSDSLAFPILSTLFPSRTSSSSKEVKKAASVRRVSTSPTASPVFPRRPRSLSVKMLARAATSLEFATPKSCAPSAPQSASVASTGLASPVAMSNSALTKKQSKTVLGRLKTTLMDDLIPRCMSPVSTMRTCDGFCKREPADKPYVISLAACTDRQLEWEDRKGHTMIQALVHYLEQNPHTTIKDMITYISYRRYTISRKIHDLGRKKLNDRKKAQAVNANKAELDGEELCYDLVNFMDPQLGSQEKLDMDAVFTL
ncbi:uncharacterized protein FIBRA_08080 [Fibroporia radiculosa]|uniref:Caspase family p20 domain-containing protein n=1 Tax=Fibroporia radiculosa TaxID=599839 RepID=J4H4Z4_9APHY|nr:uncharacterized protein FIBRA_08080 [Fibroporia radiculosa]CCM05844.1 predicted protein [Fibroporia radiculosa]